MMSNYRHEYKKNISNSRNLIENRFIRAEKQKKSRSNQRVNFFNANRNLSSSSPKIHNKTPSNPRNEDRFSKLTKFKTVCDKQKRLDQVKKKPPFVVGLVHHKIYSPANNSVSTVLTKKRDSIPKRISKVTEKKLMARISAVNVNTKELINDPNTLNNRQRNQKKDQSSISDNSKDKLSCNPLIPKVIIEKLSPTKIMSSVSKIQQIHNRISNYKNGVNENQQLQYDSSLSHSTNDISIQDNVTESLNISVQRNKLSTHYFQFLLNKETDILNKLCEKWMKLKTAPETPENGQYQINQAIGQASLLMSKKFDKFYELIIDCETGEGEMLVTCKDLKGFWDMMYTDVKNCHSRFEKLEKLCSQGWEEEELPKAVSKKKAIVSKKVVFNKRNSIRSFLGEKKKKITEKVRNSDTNKLQSNINQAVNNRSIKDRNRKTKSMFIGPNGDKATFMKHDKKLSLIHKIQLSERLKKIDSPLTIMKISRMCKTPRVRSHNFKSSIKSNRTSEKSILNQRKSPTKVQYPEFANKVNFDDHTVLNEVPVDEKTQIRKDLAVLISKAKNSVPDYFDHVLVNVKKKLAFEDNSFEESIFNMEQNVVKESPTSKKIHTLPSTHIQSVTPLQESNENVTTSRRSTRKQNIGYEHNQTINKISPLNINISMLFEETTNDTDLNLVEKEIQKNVSVSGKEEIVEHNNSIRVLRNRTITSMDTPIIKRRFRKRSINIQNLKHKENETPVLRRRTMNAFHDNVDNNKRMDTDSYANITHSEKDIHKRRSTRCIKFAVKECPGCMYNINKSTLPVTPYIRRSKAHSSNKKDS